MEYYAQSEDYWEDLRTPSSLISIFGFGTDPNRDATYGTLVFDSSTTETVWVIYQLPHSYKDGSTLKPHVHWARTTSASGGVYWQLEYRWSKIGEVMDGSWTTIGSSTEAVSTGNTAEQHGITSLGDISGTGAAFSDMLICKLSRVPSNGGDTYGADARLLEFDIHYQGRTFGTANETSR